MTTPSDHAAALDEPLDAEGAVGAAECQSAEDFYASHARDTVGRFCQRFLDESALTATELLHSPRHQQSLSNLPAFVGILQQAERLLGHKGGLTALVNEVARLTRERLKSIELPDLTPQNIATSVAALLNSHGSLGRFFAEAAITAHLQPSRTFAEKARLLLELAGGTDDGDALALIDRVLGEMLRSHTALASITNDAPFGRTVDLIVTLVAADQPMEPDAPKLLRMLDGLLRRVPMPVTSDGLMVAFRRELAKPDQHFTIASTGDLFGIDTVQREVMALAGVATRLRTGGGYLGGEKTEAALQRRGALLVNEDSLHEIIRGRNYVQKLRTLFVLHKMPLPQTAGRAVATCLKQFFDNREFAGRLLDCWKERTERLKGLAEVQGLVLDSAFDDDDRDYMAQQIDDIQSTFLRTQRVLGPLTGKLEPSLEQVVDILKLAADKAFCVGKSSAAVGRALHRSVHRPRFVRGFLLSAPGGRERTLRLNWLRGALAEVGVAFIEVADLRVLVVDDEDGPRNYVESVLQDLGFGAIVLARDGRDALDRIAEDAVGFDLIICDWMMPRASGLDVLREVRTVRPDLPFLMVTALATQRAVERALAHNVSAYIAKPFTPEQLEEKVFVLLSQRTMAANA